jgi:hypothetical protein
MAMPFLSQRPSQKNVLAFDFGASSGRAMIGAFDGTKILLKEIHRFSNDPVYLNGTLYWDTLRQHFEIKQGILHCYPTEVLRASELTRGALISCLLAKPYNCYNNKRSVMNHGKAN